MKPWPELDLTDRWRLLLGEASAPSLGAGGEVALGMDQALAWLYGRDGPDGRGDAGDGLERHAGARVSVA